MKKLINLSLVAISLFFIACNDDETVLDTEKPIVIINSPTANEEIDSGEQMDLNATFTDNVELATYKVEIHFGGDGHEHKTLNNEHEDHIEWNYQTTGVLNGQADTIQLQIDVPEKAEEGLYHLGVYAIDKAGNENVSWITFDLHNHSN